MASGIGTRGTQVVVVLATAAGIYFAWPHVKKWIDQPAPHLKATAPIPVSPLGSSLEKRMSNGMTSAELRDSLIEKSQKSKGTQPTLAEWMQLTTDDYAAVQTAIKANPSHLTPSETSTPSPFSIPKDKLITPHQTAGVGAYLQQLKESAISKPALAGEKKYLLEEVVELVQPAVPMIQVRQTVKCVIAHTVLSPNTKTPVTTRHTVELETGGSGSGFFIDANGHVVTNCHVAGPPKPRLVLELAFQKLGMNKEDTIYLVGEPELLNQQITLVIQGKHRPFAKSIKAVGPAEAERPFELPAELVGYDSHSDLAVIKVNGCTFPYLTFADPNGMKVGQAVTSVGYPKGDAIPGPPTAIGGTINGLDRTPMRGDQADSVQHSATINNGNSGGPLINREGQVVGVNTYGFADTSVQNINFSRGPRTTAPFVEQLIRHGRVVRPDTGLRVMTPDFRSDTVARDVNLTYATAVAVFGIVGESSAELTDIILQVNGRSVTTEGEWNDALGLLEKTRPASLRLTIKRAPASLRAEAVKKQVDWAVVLRAAWEAKETDITIALKWPQ